MMTTHPSHTLIRVSTDSLDDVKAALALIGMTLRKSEVLKRYDAVHIPEHLQRQDGKSMSQLEEMKTV
jgi:hypothetical protein